MRLIAVLSIFVASACAQSPEKDAVAAVQTLFDGMKTHDEAKILGGVLPDAKLYAIRDTGAPTSANLADFAKRIATMKGDLVERFTETPQVLIRGNMAQVWGEYDFIRDGKFDHCGVDSVSLFKTADGWKIAAIAYTSETTGCKGH